MLNSISYANRCHSFSAFQIEPNDKKNQEQFNIVLNTLNSNTKVFLNRFSILKYFMGSCKIKAIIKPRDATNKSRLRPCKTKS